MLKQTTTKIGAVLSFITAALLFIQQFAPSEWRNKNVEFVVSVIRTGLFEIGVLLLLSLILLFWNNIKDFFEKNETVGRYTVYTLIGIFLVNLLNLYYIARARVYHYSNITRVHRKQFYEGIDKSLNSLDYDKATYYIEGLISQYPSEKYAWEDLITNLPGRIQYANFFYDAKENSVLIKNENSVEMISRTNYLHLMTATSLYPSQHYYDDLIKAERTLSREFELLHEYLDKIQNGCNDKSCSDYLNKSKWFLFSASSSQGKDFQLKYPNGVVINYVTDFDENEFISLLRKQWMIDELKEKILEYEKK